MKHIILTITLITLFKVAQAQDLFPDPEHLIVHTERARALKTLTADLNNDGYMDVIRLHYWELLWYKNDGSSSFNDERFIDSLPSTSSNRNIISIGDLDGDNDQDIIIAREHVLIWYKNDGIGNFSKEEIINHELFDFKHIEIVDMNNDQKMDILYFNDEDNRIAWMESPWESSRFEIHTIDYEDSDFKIITTDIDGDNNVDVIKYGSHINIYWYKNLGSSKFSSTAITIPTSSSISIVIAMDINKDSFIDLMYLDKTSEHKIIWLKQLEDHTFEAEKPVIDGPAPLLDFDIVDIDNDGDFDIITNSEELNTARGSTLSVFINVGDEEFNSYYSTPGSYSYYYPNEITTADMDNDGDFDVLVSNLNHGLTFYENAAINGELLPGHHLLNGFSRGFSSSALTDLDGDGLLDIVAGSYLFNGITWYKNLDGQGTFSEMRIISKDSDVSDIKIGDLDGDGDQDIVASYSADANGIVWYENIDGLGIFSDKQTLIEGQHFSDLHLVDLDNDNDQDIIATNNSQEIIWFENEYNRGIFNVGQLITLSEDLIMHIHPVDLDNDGDIDIVSTYRFNDQIVWFENEFGIGTFRPKQIIGNFSKRSTILNLDFDQDGDQDIICSSTTEGISWLENQDNASSFSLPNEITAEGFETIHLADIDGDAHPDLLSGTTDKKLVWFPYNHNENTFKPAQHISRELYRVTSISTGDIDNDGDLDVLSATTDHHAYDFSCDKLSWYENTSIVAGINEDEAISLSVHPIPASSYLKIESEEEIEELHIISIDGIDLFTKTVNKKTDQIPLSSLKEGTYILKVIFRSGKEHATLFVRE